MKDYKIITDQMKLNKIFIDENNTINFEDFYLHLIPKLKKPYSKTKEILRLEYKSNFIEISRKSSRYCDINLYKDKKYDEIIKSIDYAFIKPIIIFYKTEIIQLAYLGQFGGIPGLLQIKKPYLFCLNDDDKMDYDIKNLITHQEFHLYNCMIEICDISINEEISERKFLRAFKFAQNSDEFENPIHFDINYESYFDYYKYQIKDKKFEFLDDDNESRDLFISNLCCPKRFLGLFRIYYGLTGMGKSITLIKAFKYNYKHDYYGILYIHCKYLYKNYNNQNIHKVKKILKDEIIFLFKNEYETFKKCERYIDNYKNDNKNFLNLVVNIITKFCTNKTKNYIFIFDQYKPEYDPKNILDDLNNSLIRKNKNYGMIACCSMDNETVRELKVKNLSSNLFQEELDTHADNVIIEEINKIFDISKYTIDKGNIYDKTLNKIGKNLRNYIVLKDYFRRNDYNGMEEYVEIKKEKIEKNLKEFFKLNKNVKEEDDISNLSYLYNILSFTVDTDYTLDYIKLIKKNIPFKYFDIKFSNDSSNLAKIVFNYELVGEVMNKIYESIIYENNNIYQIFDNIKLDEGALDELYEKYVIHFMEPDQNSKQRKLFKLFNITNIMMVEKFIPPSNKNFSTHKYKIKHLKEGDYLFKQNIFGRKSFDCVIIRVRQNNSAEAFFFQISIYKKTLYSIDKLKTNIKTFIDYFSFKFDLIIKEEDVFFTYIFNNEKKKDLYDRCNKNNLKCIFFNPSVQKFMNINNDILDDIDYIDDINNIFINPFKFNN